jgi:hypothetical protein
MGGGRGGVQDFQFFGEILVHFPNFYSPNSQMQCVYIASKLKKNAKMQCVYIAKTMGGLIRT